MFQNTKILIYGFSVTADKNSYALRAKEWLEAEYQGCKVDIIGTGGVDVDFPLIAADSLFKAEYDYVILEIMTGLQRATSMSPDHFMTVYKSILVNLQAKKIKPIFLELYREDVDPQADAIRPLVQSLHETLGIPALSLFEETRQLQLQEGALLHDRVHTTPLGADFYATKLCQFLGALEARLAGYKDLEFTSPYLCLHVGKLLQAPQYAPFYRTGYREKFCAFSHSLEITLEAPAHLTSVTFMMGPDTAYMSLTSDMSSQAQMLKAFDRHSYYYRIGQKSFPPLLGQKFTFTTSEIPAHVKLMKGTPSEKEKLSRIAHLNFIM